MLVFRSFSKAWGLAGLRCGYAVGAPEAASLLAQLEPDLGVNDLAQHGALEALRAMEPQVRAARRDGAPSSARASSTRSPARRTRSRPRRRTSCGCGCPGVDGAELAARLERHQVIVQPGGAIGSPDHVRAFGPAAPARRSPAAGARAGEEEGAHAAA